MDRAIVKDQTTQTDAGQFQGALRVIVIPHFTQRTAIDPESITVEVELPEPQAPLQPRISPEELQAIATLLRGYVPDGVYVQVLNPTYQQVKVEAEVAFVVAVATCC